MLLLGPQSTYADISGSENVVSSIVASGPSNVEARIAGHLCIGNISTCFAGAAGRYKGIAWRGREEGLIT